MSDYDLYIGVINHRKNEMASSLPVLSKTEPTPEQVAKAWGIDYDIETETEIYIEVSGPKEIKVID